VEYDGELIQMKVSIEGQSHLLVDLVANLQVTSHNLSDKQASQVDKMGSKISEFVTQYILHSQLTISEFASYLNHDALSPLTVVMGYAELFRTVQNESLTEPQFILIEDICAIIGQLTENVRALRNELVAKQNAVIS
jgi:signal transduction histidine kinase